MAAAAVGRTSREDMDAGPGRVPGETDFNATIGRTHLSIRTLVHAVDPQLDRLETGATQGIYYHQYQLIFSQLIAGIG